MAQKYVAFLRDVAVLVAEGWQPFFDGEAIRLSPPGIPPNPQKCDCPITALVRWKRGRTFGMRDWDKAYRLLRYTYHTAIVIVGAADNYDPWAITNEEFALRKKMLRIFSLSA